MKIPFSKLPKEAQISLKKQMSKDQLSYFDEFSFSEEMGMYTVWYANEEMLVWVSNFSKKWENP